ncbi:hypothetical protein [Emticicia agri]|uniref:Lipoprotein n=1 Tax=Emticicia agri TaxID=2492393 RepID=A0A4Q5LWI9_9BACT|nr:hypothetical protein [Emticicia agri]RYU94098.1 hypothetical protein EWM59_18735 [Emticicia agri]
MKVYLLFFIIISTGCAKNTLQTKNCDLQEAQVLSQKKMNRFNEGLNSLKLTTTQDSSFYHINYRLKDSLADGGGAYFRISKKNCKIEEIRRYQ